MAGSSSVGRALKIGKQLLLAKAECFSLSTLESSGREFESLLPALYVGSSQEVKDSG